MSISDAKLWIAMSDHTRTVKQALRVIGTTVLSLFGVKKKSCKDLWPHWITRPEIGYRYMISMDLSTKWKRDLWPHRNTLYGEPWDQIPDYFLRSTNMIVFSDPPTWLFSEIHSHDYFLRSTHMIIFPDPPTWLFSQIHSHDYFLRSTHMIIFSNPPTWLFSQIRPSAHGADGRSWGKGAWEKAGE